MKSPKIQAVIFDMGEVLIRLNFSCVMEALGLPKDQPIKLWLEDVDALRSYDAFERGAISEKDFFAPHPSVRSVWNTVLQDPVEEIDGILDRLRKIIPIHALTNTNVTHLTHAIANYPFLSHFETIFSSHEIGARKPEKKIYHHVEQTLKLPGSSLLFFDDREENIEGARKLGWNAELCTDSPSDILLALKKYHLA